MFRSSHTPSPKDFLPQERWAVARLGAIFATRLLGLFVVLPVLTLHSESLIGTTSALLGLAAGIYGLTTALMQLPLGWYSDRIGRKPVLIIGQLIFILGSLICAISTHIVGLIVGRALQGVGAVGSTLMAAMADATRVEIRTRAMAMMGMMIGMAFLIGLGLGPILQPFWGVRGLFLLSAGLGTIGLLMLLSLGSSRPQISASAQSSQKFRLHLQHVLEQARLRELIGGIGALHGMLMASFVIWPKLMAQSFTISGQTLSYLYLKIIFLSAVIVFPLIRYLEQRQKIQSWVLGILLCLMVSQILMGYAAYQGYFPIFTFGLFLFFIAFNFLEAYLPAQMSQWVSPELKGTAMGVFSSMQFLGIFLGGLIGGWIHAYSPLYLFLFCGVTATLWFLKARKNRKD